MRLISFFFFQAEDGIRDGHVTGVQTCALPIYFLGRSTEEIRQYREEWQNHGERFGHVEGYVGHGGPGKNREGMGRIPAPELPPIRMRPRKNPPPHARLRD